MSSMSSEEREVIVVGGGPVGLAIASALDYYGVKVTLIEKKTSTSFLAKSITLSGRTMEHFRRIGLEKAVQNAAYPRNMPVMLRTCTSVLNGYCPFSEKLSSWGDIIDGVPGCKFLFFQEGASVCAPLLCPQFALEPVLKRHLEDNGSKNVQMLWGWEVDALEQSDEAVTIRAVPVQEGEGDGVEGKQEGKIFRAKYIVACDGGSSPVRKIMGLQTYGKYVVARAIRIMFKSDVLATRQLEEKSFGMNIVLPNTIGASLLINLNAKGDFALQISLPPNTSDELVESHVRNASQCIVEIVGADIPHVVTAVSGYNMHALMSTKFNVGRCFFAGDSAHQWLPTGGMGLNSGVGDAFNLAWKLNAVLKGYGGLHLLDSYAAERKPKNDTTRRFVLSVKYAMGGFRQTLVGLLLSNFLTRFFVGRILQKPMFAQFTSALHLVFGYHYLHSNVIDYDFDVQELLHVNTSTTNAYVPMTLPGLRAPHLPLPGCSSILDLFGKQFVFLAIGGQESDCPELRRELELRGVPVTIYAYPKLPELVALYDRKYFVVRPDGIISWRSDIQPSKEEAVRVARVITGELPVRRVTPRKPRAIPILAGSVSSLLGSFGIVGLHELTNLPFRTTVGVGLGLFWFLTLCRTWPPKKNVESTGRHKAALVRQFGQAKESLEIESKSTQKFGPGDVLVSVHAASVNPIDVKIRQGYGSSLVHCIARSRGHDIFPLLLGHDCSGEVVAVGDDVTQFAVGDQVYGVSAAGFGRGTHAQLVPLDEDSVALKPPSLEHRDAASLPYVAVTAFSALVDCVGLSRNNARGKRVLIHGGTGGIGSFAVQLLKAWGVEVTVTCSEDNIPLAHRLGADLAFDYRKGDFSQVLHGYDVVLDTIGSDYERRSLSVLKTYGGASYVTVVTPYITFLSTLGPILGAIAYLWVYRCKVVLNRLIGGRAFYYVTAKPSRATLEEVREMVERGEIRPVVEAAYPLEEIILAHQHVEDGHTRGKVVVTMP